MKLGTEISCPGCQKKIKVDIQKLLAGQPEVCPDCHTEIALSADEARQAQVAIEAFEASMKKLA